MNNARLDADVIFMSYEEPNADANFRRLQELAPSAKRVHGVRGIFQAHQAAARLSASSHFFLVDGDNWVWDNFALVLRNQRPVVDIIFWGARNAVNGLLTYHGGPKMLSRDAVLTMDESAVDFFQSMKGRRVAVTEVVCETRFNTTPFLAWRDAFRECAKLAGGIVKTALAPEALKTWQEVGADQLNGAWCVLGAKMGAAFGSENRGSETLRLINDYQWLKTKFEQLSTQDGRPSLS